MVTKAKRTANNKWDAEHMSNVACKVRKDEAEAFRNYAKSNNTTVNKLLADYVRRCIQNEDNKVK